MSFFWIQFCFLSHKLWVVQSRVSAKFDFRYESWEGNSVLFFLPTIWCCKKKRENYLRKCFEQKKKKPALTFNSSKVSANQPSNNWAQNYNYTWLFFFFEICRSSVPRKKKRRKDHTRTRAQWAMTLINTPPPPLTHTHPHTHPLLDSQVQIPEEPPKISPGVKSSTELPTVLLH